jgi:neutral/alkaline ceramidase-like enzyme
VLLKPTSGNMIMKRLFRFALDGVLGLATLLALVSGPTIRADSVAPLRAGAAAVDITPKQFPVNMPGGFNANMAEKAHDPLHARALVLDDGKTQLAIVVVDNLGVGREAVDEAKFLASRRCGILPEKILISATHTHSAPPSNVTDGPKEAVAYRKILVEGIAEAIVRAHGNLRPAAVGSAAHPLPDEVFNRRWFLKPGKMPLNPFGGKDLVKMNPGTSPDVLLHAAGPTDPDVSVLSVQDAKTRKPLAIYANYSLHYVGGIPRAMVSADYFGEFARLMPTRVGAKAEDGFVAMLSNGASGDINNIPFNVTPPRPPREPFEQIRIVAGKTADAAWHARNKITAHQTDVRLGMMEREITLRLRKPSAEQTERAKTIIALKDEAERAKLPPLAEAYAHRSLALARAGETLKVPLQAIRIGDTAICAMPFETFVEIGLDLKRRSPFPRTIVVGICNGYNGYLPTPEHHKLGGYETWLGTNKVQEDASVILTDQLLEMLADLAKQK